MMGETFDICCENRLFENDIDEAFSFQTNERINHNADFKLTKAKQSSLSQDLRKLFGSLRTSFVFLYSYSFILHMYMVFRLYTIVERAQCSFSDIFFDYFLWNE